MTNVIMCKVAERQESLSTHLMPVGRRDTIVGRSEIGRCHNEVHVKVGVIILSNGGKGRGKNRTQVKMVFAHVH